MPFFAAIFEDDADQSARIRAAFTDEHVAWLASRGDQVLLAGALTPADGGAATGGLWVIQAETADEARRLVAEDPFYREGLRKSFKLEGWSRGFPKHAVTI
jgi:uncharacterized protein YciI